MADEGKLARAMAKAGESDRLGAVSEHSQSPERLPPPPHSPAAAAQPPIEVRRVTDRHTQPAHDAVIVQDRFSEIAVQIRGLRAKLVAINHGRPPRVITISSGGRAEGKTTVAFNLAVALAEVDPGRILVLDGDTLKPALHRIAGVNANGGLTELLHNKLDLNDHIYETNLPNLDIIPGGSENNETIERLLHANVAQLLATLRRMYSFIIVDTPPVLAGSQACMFGKHSDGVIMVARLERTPRQVVRRAADELANAGAKVVGCILTHHKHHVPDAIYRFFGTTPAHYYRYGRSQTVSKPETPQAATESQN